LTSFDTLFVTATKNHRHRKDLPIVIMLSSSLLIESEDILLLFFYFINQRIKKKSILITIQSQKSTAREILHSYFSRYKEAGRQYQSNYKVSNQSIYKD